MVGPVRWLVVEEKVFNEEINMSFYQSQHTIQHNLPFYCKNKCVCFHNNTTCFGPEGVIIRLFA
jgi:hypothetical protein